MPGTPLPGLLAKAQLRSGYEVAPKVLSYRPYLLNSPGIRKQAPAVLSNPGQLKKFRLLIQRSGISLPFTHKLIPAGATLHSFQISVSNRVLMQLGDAVVITPTGSGKSLTWVLPLLARSEGVSLVITPFTSLGLEAISAIKMGILNTIYIYSERNTATDFELVQEGSMLIVYVCPEMLESPRFAPLVHSKDWAQHISAIYIDEAHLVQEAVSWRPSYSRLHMLRNVLGHNIPLICLSAHHHVPPNEQQSSGAGEMCKSHSGLSALIIALLVSACHRIREFIAWCRYVSRERKLSSVDVTIVRP
ncbi:hypothetical protein B0H14DRAFT_2425381 [Mycena olivaceomarginata]|nr:hypothetical protein B0H14DRAFT_2425381 [Mycena olivaceomarginata]